MKSQPGFTLIETLIALAIFSILIGVLMRVSQQGLSALSTAEQQLLARRALGNQLAEFRQNYRLGKVLKKAGHYQGKYAMGYLHYQWEITVVPGQAQLYLLNATIRQADKKTVLARIQEVL